MRYSGLFWKYTRKEFKQIYQRTRKLTTMHKALHPRDEVDRIYLSRKERRGLASIEDSVNASILQLEDYIEKREGGLIVAIRNESNHTMDNRITITIKEKWKKKLYKRFKGLINNISHNKTWPWQRKGNFKRETESLLIAAQIISKRELIRHNKIANVGYVVTEMKPSIT